MWRRHWPQGMEWPQALYGDESHVRISRADLFELGSSLESTEQVLDFYGQVCMWGSGSSALQVRRCVQPLNDPTTLGRISEVLLDDPARDPSDLYYRFNSYDYQRTKYLGPAFFTKLLYFRSRKTAIDQGTRVPLILDKIMAETLGWKQHGGWKRDRYVKYLDIMDEAAEELKMNVARDYLEFVLFTR